MTINILANNPNKFHYKSINKQFILYTKKKIKKIFLKILFIIQQLTMFQLVIIMIY
jgi:hypothetical protein